MSHFLVLSMDLSKESCMDLLEAHPLKLPSSHIIGLLICSIHIGVLHL